MAGVSSVYTYTCSPHLKEVVSPDSSPSLPTSEDLPEPPRETRGEEEEEGHESHEERLVTQSYARLARISLTPFTQGGGAGGEDRWHDWFRMQRQWSEQVEGDNQNYFDDGL